MFAPPPLPRTLEAAIRDLSSDKPATRASAIADLVRHATASDSTRTRALPLLEKLLQDEAPAVRSAAAVGLGDIDATSALPALLVALEDTDALVRQMAINALGELRDPRAAARLRRALKDERPDVRYQAVIAYSRVMRDDPSEVVTVLVRALGDDDAAVRYIALRIAEEWVDERRAIPPDNLALRAKSLLDDDEGEVVVAAAILLAKLGDDAGKAVILEVVREGASRKRKPPKEDERAAVELVGELGLREAIPALEKRVWGVARYVRDTCAWHAKVALAAMGHGRAIAEIERDLDGTARDVVEAAVVAVGRARLATLRPRLTKLAKASADPALVAEALGRLDIAPGTPGSFGSLASGVRGARVSR